MVHRVGGPAQEVVADSWARVETGELGTGAGMLRVYNGTTFVAQYPELEVRSIRAFLKNV